MLRVPLAAGVLAEPGYRLVMEPGYRAARLSFKAADGVERSLMDGTPVRWVRAGRKDAHDVQRVERLDV
jgi:hypothetical protein